MLGRVRRRVGQGRHCVGQVGPSRQAGSTSCQPGWAVAPGRVGVASGGGLSRRAGWVVASGGVEVVSGRGCLLQARVCRSVGQDRRHVRHGGQPRGSGRQAGVLSCQAGAALCQAGSVDASGRVEVASGKAGRRARRGQRRVSQGEPSRQVRSASRQPGRAVAPGRVYAVSGGGGVVASGRVGRNIGRGRGRGRQGLPCAKQGPSEARAGRPGAGDPGTASEARAGRPGAETPA